MIKSIQNWWYKRTLYLQTYRELQSLTDYELRDLGLDRGTINTIAYESAYGTGVDADEFSFRKAVAGLFKFNKKDTARDRATEWLNESTDIVDLERRLKMLDMNQAPWQLQAKTFSYGWAQ